MNGLQTFPSVNSLWQATSHYDGDYPALTEDKQVDVIIIGGGYTGLSAAHHLASKGLQPLILDAHPIGWGGSGRNGGVITAKYRMTFPDMARQFDLQTARHMHRIAHQAVDHVAELIDDYGLERACFRRSGNLKCVHNEHVMAQVRNEVEWLRRELGDRTLSLLSKEQVAEETGSPAFVGGMLATDVGTLHPLNYSRGLAAGLTQRWGTMIHCHSSVADIRADSHQVSVTTSGGQRVTAAQLIMATNAYSSLTPATRFVRKRLIPFRSSMIATEPLSAGQSASLLKEERSYVETRRMMRWFRKAEGRLLFGGRGAFGKHDSQPAFDALYRAMVELFPSLAGINIDYQWSGHVAMTLDALPHVGRIAPRICVAGGYNGAGVAQSSYLGTLAAQFAAGESPEVALLDIHRLRAVPLYPLREAGIRLMAGWYQFLDAIGR